MGGEAARERMRKLWSRSVGRKLTFEEALELEFTSSGYSAPKVKD
jgi:hypothetical protein